MFWQDPFTIQKSKKPLGFMKKSSQKCKKVLMFHARCPELSFSRDAFSHSHEYDKFVVENPGEEEL